MNVLGKVVRRLGRRPRFEYRLVMCRDLDGTVPTFRSRDPLQIEELRAEAGHVEEVLAAIPTAYRNDVAQRIAAGDQCWVARSSGEVVYEAWVGIGSTYSYTLDRRLPLERTDATIYGAYTVPAARGGGIHSAVTAQVLAALRDRGLARLIALLEPDNAAALRMPEKLGFRTVGSTGFIEIFGVRFYFVRDGGFLAQVQPRQYWRKV